MTTDVRLLLAKGADVLAGSRILADRKDKS